MGHKRFYRGSGKLLVWLGNSEVCKLTPFLLISFTCYPPSISRGCKRIKDRRKKDKDTFRLKFYFGVYVGYVMFLIGLDLPTTFPTFASVHMVLGFCNSGEGGSLGSCDH